jgi:16S rRNA (cytidine1402-2'-O)-methyltransferase
MKVSTPQIYLIPTTIAPGTQDQVLAPAVKEVIKSLDYYLVEHIRTARRFIASLGLKDLSTLHLELFNKSTDASELDNLLRPISQGFSIGVISEAGCPAIADPGNKIVQWAHRNNVKVTPLAGPSSILMALMASGMNGQHFEFHGYLPIDSSLRAKAIQTLESQSLKTGKTQIFMETPYRNMSLAKDLVKHCRPNTSICIACNLTAKEEFIKTLTANAWKNNLPDLNKKPTIFLMQATL